MRLSDNYCGKDESEEQCATSLESHVMRAKFACHRLAERGLSQFMCSMLHFILLKKAAG